MNDHDTANNFKLNYMSGQSSREVFWNQINSSLNEIRKVQHLLGNKVSTIEVSDATLVLNYRFWNSESIKLVIPENDLRTAPFTILANGYYESLLENIIFKLSTLSKEFLDIGANMGFYSIGASLINEKLKVIAVEPNPKIRESLVTNIGLNRVENRVEILELALSNFKGDAIFSVPVFTGSGGGSLRNLHPEEGAPEEFSVKVEKLDNLQSKIGEADLFKIDVEGAEYQLIKGGFETIKKGYPTIVIELLRKWMKPFQSTPQEVVELLTQQGYICFAVGDTNIRKTSLINELTVETNFIFCHIDRSEHLQVLSNLSHKN